MDPDFITGLESYVWEGQKSVEQSVLDSYVVCLGTRGSGKGSILTALGGGASKSSLEGGVGKATLGMEYMYIRCPPREAGVTQVHREGEDPPTLTPPAPLYRELAHVWEVGGCAATGGAAAAEWLQIPVTPQRLPANVLLLVLDCGTPLSLCSSALAMLAMVRRRVEECCDKLHKAVAAKGTSGGEGGSSSSGSSASPPALPPPEALYTMARARQCVGRAGGTSATAATHDIGTWAGAIRALEELPPHPDAATPLHGGGGGGGAPAASPSLLPLPAIFIASRWDCCTTTSSFPSPAAAATARAALLGALRYLALAHGAALVAWSKEDKASTVALKGLFHAAAFGGPIPQQQQQQQRGAAGSSGSGSGSGSSGSASSLPFFTWGQDSLGEIVAFMEREGLAKPGMDVPTLGRGDRPLEERLQGFAAGVREGWGGGAPAASVGAVAGAGAGAAGAGVGEGGVGKSLQLQFPESAIDALVAAKEAAAAAERDAKERERRMEAAEKRAAKAAGGGTGGGASG